MRTAPFLIFMAFACVTAATMAAGPIGPRPFQGPIFQSSSQLFAWITSDRNLGHPFDEKLVAQVQADSHIDHVRDHAEGPITVVRVELLNPDGSSRARSKDGNFPFYVLRETPKGMVLMGRMFGRSYTSHLRDRNLEFDVELHPSAAETVQMHFRVEDDRLINLSAPPHRFEDVIAHRAAGLAAPDSPT
jgi:hypothetical protein